jgi:hypothetical protein
VDGRESVARSPSTRYRTSPGQCMIRAIGVAYLNGPRCGRQIGSCACSETPRPGALRASVGSIGATSIQSNSVYWPEGSPLKVVNQYPPQTEPDHVPRARNSRVFVAERNVLELRERVPSCVSGNEMVSLSQALARKRSSPRSVQIACSESAHTRHKANGRHWIRTGDFHRVRMVREPENHTPQALIVSMVPMIRMDFKGSVHLSLHGRAVTSLVQILSPGLRKLGLFASGCRDSFFLGGRWIAIVPSTPIGFQSREPYQRIDVRD